VTTRWRHHSGWPADPGVQPVARPVKKNASVGRVGLGFFSFSPGGGPGFHRPGHSPSCTWWVALALKKKQKKTAQNSKVNPQNFQIVLNTFPFTCKGNNCSKSVCNTLFYNKTIRLLFINHRLHWR
jgi:hypothetical protein